MGVLGAPAHASTTVSKPPAAMLRPELRPNDDASQASAATSTPALPVDSGQSKPASSCHSQQITAVSMAMCRRSANSAPSVAGCQHALAPESSLQVPLVVDYSQILTGMEQPGISGTTVAILDLQHHLASGTTQCLQH